MWACSWQREQGRSNCRELVSPEGKQKGFLKIIRMCWGWYNQRFYARADFMQGKILWRNNDNKKKTQFPHFIFHQTYNNVKQSFPSCSAAKYRQIASQQQIHPVGRQKLVRKVERQQSGWANERKEQSVIVAHGFSFDLLLSSCRIDLKITRNNLTVWKEKLRGW